MTDHIKAIKGGMGKDEIPAFLLKVGVFALQKTAGYMPQQAEFEDESVTKSVLVCDDSYEAEQVISRILVDYFDVGYNMDTGEPVPDYITFKYLELMDALVKSPHRFMRDILEAEYDLPLLRKHMTIEQKKIADILEERWKEDARLHLEGKERCHLTGVISVITDERRERNKSAQRQTQATMNANIKTLRHKGFKD